MVHNHSINLSNDFQLYRHMPGIFCWEKDVNSNYVWANEEYFRAIFSLNNSQEIIGINDSYLFDDRMFNRYHDLDKEAISTKRSIKILETVKPNNTEKQIVFLTTKTPKYNNKNEITGTIGFAVDITTYLPEIVKFMMKEQWSEFTSSTVQSRYFVNQKNFGTVKLAPRESECLFFYLRHRTSKEIGRMLNLEPKTVEYYIEKAKIKLHCREKSEIFDKAIECGFLSLMPDRIFNEGFSMVLSENL